LGEDVVEDAVLVVAELLANVVVHARTPFRLSVHLREPLLRVSVSDRRVGAPAARSVGVLCTTGTRRAGGRSVCGELAA
jgi:anti-sigma regulatory factor (Ser/Thr protein kinase)